MLKAYVDPPHLDVVVCTHIDADHANGIVGLLTELPIPIREVWLPGTWAGRFEDLVVEPADFWKELARDIGEVEEEVGNLEEYYEQARERLRLRIETPEPACSPERDSSTKKWLVEILGRQGFQPPWKVFLCDVYHRIRGWIPFQWWEKLWFECLEAANRIKTIAEAALNAGAKIRLFEFVESPGLVSGGWRDQLEPVNCCEVRPRRSRVSALFYLALTKANRESLVFYAPEQDDTPGTLFTADSDLAGGLIHLPSPSTNLVVTAPHHGAEQNALAYAKVREWIAAHKAIWVRSDSGTKRRPGKTFKNQPKRLCTLCNSWNAPKAPVRLHVSRSCWRRTPGTRWCSCV